MHVPVWHEKMQAARESGRVRMLGIVQEQHGERAALFAQWKHIDWPIVYDPFAHLEVTYVPIMLGVDETGVVRKLWPAGRGADQVEEEFLAQSFEQTSHVTAPNATPVDAELRALWANAGIARLDALITAYDALVQAHPENGHVHFRRGVAYRMRHDAPGRRPGDFQDAARAWTRALEIDPNNYIWRRRLQQYGPRTAKPYPFYDWVAQARDEIRARGETPVALTVEPGDSEQARPGDVPRAAASTEPAADADRRIERDPGALIQIETTAVPARVPPGGSARLYVSLRPRTGSESHWNNEVDDLAVWVEPSRTLAQRVHTFPNPPRALSREERVVEIDVVVPNDAAPGAHTLPAYALYYVCEDAQGVCLYRRQDLTLSVEVGAATPLAGR